MPNTVRYFDSTMSGAPSLSGTAGALVGVLDACLVDGFGSVTVDSLVIASDVATATVSAGHQFAMIGDTGPVIEISGANPSALNDDWRITVTSTTEFTFATSGITNQTATGTISAKRAPAGFEKAFTDTDKAAYRSLEVMGSQLYLRTDNTSHIATTIQYESMSTIDSGSSGTPTTYLYASADATSTERKWRIYADNRFFYFFCAPWSSAPDTWYSDFVFGDYIPASSDAYASMIIGSADGVNFYNSNLPFINSGTFPGHYIARDYDGLGGYVAFLKRSHSSFVNYMRNSGLYPNPVGNQLLCAPVEVWNSASTVFRGLMPGMYAAVHAKNTITDGLVIEDVLPINRSVKVQQVNGSVTGHESTVVFDLDGPWR